MLYAPDATARYVDPLTKNSISAGYVSSGNNDGINTVGRLNSVDQGSVSGATSFTQTPTKIVMGKQTRGDLFFNGRIYAAILASQGQAPTTVSNVETYLAQKAGMTL